MWWRRRSLALAAVAFAATSAASLVASGSTGLATSGADPYSVPPVVDTNPDPNIVETTLTAENATVNIGNGVSANAMTYNGSIPGPTFMLKVGDTVIVHYHNNLSVPNGIHWHGVELSNEMDGTPFTQNTVPPGGSFLYKFTVTRPGIFWYHPHDLDSTNEVFRGMYGMIVVADPNEAALQTSGALPPAADTKQVVLSDTTVCKTAGGNPAQSYSLTLPWVGGGALPNQLGPTPKSLCETPTAIDDNGSLKAQPYNQGDIPATQPATSTRENEGVTVLTNGVNVGGRAGSPSAPGALAPGASTMNVRPGQGLRLQVLNAATTRYMRLRLTDSTGQFIPLYRVGGEGGLLDSAILEGNPQPVPAGVYDTGYVQGEQLLAPGDRADLVAAISSNAAGVMTLWTEDYSRTGMGFADIPTVPVMHLNVTGQPVSPAYAISDGTPLRAATGNPVAVLTGGPGALLNPATFNPPKLGMSSSTISLTDSGANGHVGIDTVIGTHNAANYMTAAHLGSTRYAKLGDTLTLSITNATGAHHPFHLHGFSFQPIKITEGATTYNWPTTEFRDTVDIPGGATLVFKVKLDDRPMPDGVTMGGALGRWMFHCHIFFHAELGMLGELVVVPDSSGKERPDVNVDSSDVHVNAGATATVTGTYADPQGQPVTLTSSVGSVHDDGGGHYTWTFPTGSALSQIVYITATDTSGLKAQIPFSLDIKDLGPPVLKLPGSQTVQQGSKLTFKVSATDPDAADKISFGAASLPTGLALTDNGDGTATVSGTVTAPPGMYTAVLSASDGKNPAVTGNVTITVTPKPELSATVGSHVKLRHGAITVGCKTQHKTLQSCTVTVVIAGKTAGSATAHVKHKGRSSVTVSVHLRSSARHKIAGAKHGVAATIKLTAHEFGSKSKFSASGHTTIVR
jgi:FtsP/CotA-like multicopper oxidase with cupredoxin domain